MSDKSELGDEEMKRLKIEDSLPVTAVGVENLKEANPKVMSPHRFIFKWFARRPTAATRLAILASILPSNVSDDELLRLMQIGPKENIERTIEEYVLSKEATKSERTGSQEEHFGYRYPVKSVPNEQQMSELQSTLRDHWGGQLPTVLDPTAGGGTIPMEALRYNLPTYSNELNPVAWVLNKVILEYAPEVGSLEEEVRRWMEEIENYVRADLEPYHPKKKGVEPEHYFRCYSIECPICGNRLPLTDQWWFDKKQSVAVRPLLSEDSTGYTCVKIPDEVEKSEFNPSEGTVSGGDAECLHCTSVIENEKITEIFKAGDYRFEVCAVRYTEEVEGATYHGATAEDKEAIRKAAEKIDSSLDFATLLKTAIPKGKETSKIHKYGLKEWRDIFSPRQLLSHATYLQAFQNIKSDVRNEYSSEKSEAILVLLGLIATKLINRNSRLEPLDVRHGYPANMLGTNNFTFKWHFGESNLMAGGYSYQSEADNVLSNYEDVVDFFINTTESAQVRRGDAADLPIDDNSIEAVVMDPPYGDNVIYSELSDSLYVWLKNYFGDIFSSEFQMELTNKTDEAVENSQVVDPPEGKSKTEAAREGYENKMADIFSECFRVMKPGGVITIYFTDKETSAWDSLTMSLIQSGFTVTATHTITSEVPQRIGQRNNASADSTLLLTCRKPQNRQQFSERTPTLWSDIKSQTEQVAQERASELLDSNLNLTKTDIIISAFGPTLRVFTENYPVVDKHDDPVRPRSALETARTAVTEILIDRELDEGLEGVDGLTRWYVLMYLVYERSTVPYDDAHQLGIGVGVEIDDLKRETKIWKKSGNKLTLAGQSNRVRNITALEGGEKRRKRAFPVDPRENSFEYNIDAVHAALNVLETKGSDYAWNWIKDRGLQKEPSFKRTIQSLMQVLPESHDDHQSLVNLLSGDTGELLDIDSSIFGQDSGTGEDSRTTLDEF